MTDEQNKNEADQPAEQRGSGSELTQLLYGLSVAFSERSSILEKHRIELSKDKVTDFTIRECRRIRLREEILMDLAACIKSVVEATDQMQD